MTTYTATHNPLTAIDNLVASRLTGYAPLAAVIPSSAMQIWDREVDIRGEIERAPDLGPRLWIRPLPSRTEMSWSSGSVRFTRRYAIGFGRGTMALPNLRLLEWLVSLAFVDGQTIATAGERWINPSPIEVEFIEIGATDPEREPIDDPQEWNDLCEVTVVGHAPRAALIQESAEMPRER